MLPYVHYVSRQLPRGWSIPTYPLSYSTITFVDCEAVGMKNWASSLLHNCFLSTPVYEDLTLHNSPDILVQLDTFSSKLESNYEALKKSKDGSGITHPDSTFKASSTLLIKPLIQSSPTRAPDSSWQCWFDSKTCDICGQVHPTKYHNDPGIQNRPFIPKPSSQQHYAAKSSSSFCPSNHSRPCFKKGGRGTFICSVHKALVENVEILDDDFLANMLILPLP